MPRKASAKTSNPEKYKPVKEYANKLKTKTDDIAVKIKELYENNVWDLETKFKQLEQENAENSINRDIAWLQGVQYLDYNKMPRVTKKISLKMFKAGEYKSLYVDKPNTPSTEANYAKRIEFYTKTFQPFKKYKGKDDITWVVNENHTLLYEVLKYNNEKKNVFMTLNKDIKTILRTIRLQLGNTHELTYKFSGLSTALSDLATRADDENRVATDRELGQFINYEDLITLVEGLETDYNEELNKLPETDRKNGDKHNNMLYHMHQLHLLVALYVYDYPSRAEKLEMKFITDEKAVKPDKNYILVRTKGECKMIFNEIKKLHKPLSYNLKTDTPVLSGFNKKLNELIKKSYKTYPRESVLIGKTEWNSGKRSVTAGTASNWLLNIYKNKNLGVNAFRSSFVSYYNDQMNNSQKKQMATRMRTSTFQIDQSYRKIVKAPEDLVKVKIEPGLELEARASIGTSRDTAYRIGEDNTEYIRPAIPISDEVAVIKQKKKIVNTHERKRKNFNDWYKKDENKEKHNKAVKERSKQPITYAKRIVRELNNKMLNIKNLQPTTIAKYGINKEGDLWTYNLPK